MTSCTVWSYDCRNEYITVCVRSGQSKSWQIVMIMEIMFLHDVTSLYNVRKIEYNRQWMDLTNIINGTHEYLGIQRTSILVVICSISIMHSVVNTVILRDGRWIRTNGQYIQRWGLQCKNWAVSLCPVKIQY